jgi:Holliday junction resolvase RusA-like endonuclease
VTPVLGSAGHETTINMPAIPANYNPNSPFPPTEAFFLPVALAFVFLPLVISLVLFRESSLFIRNVMNSTELDILVLRSVAGEPVSVRIIMHGEPQLLQPVRYNRKSLVWYDPLGRMKEEMKRRIREELRALKENMPIFPGLTQRLKVSITFVVHTNKDVDNMRKPFLDVLEGLVYENDSVVIDIHATKQGHDGYPSCCSACWRRSGSGLKKT